VVQDYDWVFVCMCVFLLDDFLKFCSNFRCHQQLVYFFTWMEHIELIGLIG
jgi:hypothetical protein